MIEEIKSRLNGDLFNSILIGDRLETDILMGNKLGIDTALVSTGVKLYENGNSDIKPTYYLNSVADVLKQ
ncbi:MAG: HAD hydrolase-like protein [Ignavibacteriales bacterium]|nr:HAD hydrolase-like protein [Ignavibacteriales bacterium]